MSHLVILRSEATKDLGFRFFASPRLRMTVGCASRISVRFLAHSTFLILLSVLSCSRGWSAEEEVWKVRPARPAEQDTFSQFADIAEFPDILRVRPSGQLRLRQYEWDFEHPAGFDNEYGYSALRGRAGFEARKGHWALKSAWQGTQIWGLPTGASAGAGTGPVYFANGDGSTSPSGNGLKFLHVDADRLGNSPLGISVGRRGLESGRLARAFSDDYYDKQLSLDLEGERKAYWLKKKRVSGRLISEYDWTDFSRSFDGAQAEWAEKNWSGYIGYFHPTQGLAEERFFRTLEDVGLLAAELDMRRNFPWPGAMSQIFYYHYDDSRNVQNTTVRSDNANRTLAPGSEQEIALHNLGGHLTGSLPGGAKNWDVVLWWDSQWGGWFESDHRAYAFAAEVGYQWTDAPWQPWLRCGLNAGSGDSDGQDGRHETFFMMLPSRQAYIHSNQYALMNAEDVSLMLFASPQKNIRLGAEYHWVDLQDGADRWYTGIGAVSELTVVDYAAFSSGGEKDLGRELGFTFEWSLNQNLRVVQYLGWFWGEGVVARNFGADDSGFFGHSDLVLSF